LEKGWVKLASTSANQAEMIRVQLVAHGVNAIVINKQDSSYLFGEAEVFVPHDEVILAKRILDEKNA
jgi:hypothetical protein